MVDDLLCRLDCGGAVAVKVEDTSCVTLSTSTNRSVISLGDHSVELTGEITLGTTRAKSVDIEFL